MPIKMMYITNNTKVAKIAEENTVDRIWVDLEYMGKDIRQKNINSVKSNHTINDVTSIRDALHKADLLVRVNPLHADSKNGISSVIDRGADIIMLPMYKTVEDAERFIDIVAGKVKTILLLETIEAEECLEETLKIGGVDEVHIGLNDLHLAYGMKFMFQLLSNGTVERLSETIRKANIDYGFGGIARLEEGLLPAKNILGEHYRLGSKMAILSRSFYDVWHENNYVEIERIFIEGMKEIRAYEKKLLSETDEFFDENKRIVKEKVDAIVEMLEKKEKTKNN